MPLAYPFETSFGVTTARRILLVELEAEGFSAWGECVAGEHPYFSDEMVDTAWHITETELAPRLLSQEIESGRDCPALFEQIRGHRMSKSALENAVWDLDAQRQGVSLAKLLGGTREKIPSGVSIGIQPTPEKLMEKIETEVAAGYQRIKLKCKHGWDVKIFEEVRKRWPDILLSCDANSAYRMEDADHIASWDQFNLLMIEQPMWYDDFYFHAQLQKRLKTAICLDECIRNRRDAQAALQRPHPEHQGRPRRWFHRGHRRARRSRKPWRSSLVRRNAGDRHRQSAQHRAVVPAQLQAARGRLSLKALLDRRHHRTRGHSKRHRRDRRPNQNRTRL